MNEQPESNPVGAATGPKEQDIKLQEVEEGLKRQLEMEHARAGDYLRRLQYLQAEFDNYRKRVERERSEASRAVADGLLVNLLGIYDELCIAVKVARETEDKETIVSGLEMEVKKLEALFASEGMKPIEAVGKAFDPNLHEIVEHVDPKGTANHIVEEVRKGFTLRGKVIRSSLVKVGAAREDAKDGESKGD